MSTGTDSRYNRASMVLVRNQFGELQRLPYMSVLERYADIDQIDNARYTARDSDTLSNVAHRRLGSGYHWWGIAYFTGMVNPFREHETGQTLVIPSRNTFQFEVLDFELPDERVDVEV